MENAINKNVTAHQMLAVAAGLDFYVKFKSPINRAYTPKNMLTTASKLTGLKFNRNELSRAAAELRNIVGVH